MHDANNKEWNAIPWGLGAWGSMYDEKWNPDKHMPKQDREQCFDDISGILKGDSNPKMKAAIYFDSLESKIDSD